MALRNIGGVPVYSIDVEVPKPTDSRGRGYGLMVSDLRWKLWEEVKDAQLQQMKFDQMAYEAQVDILKQQQQDLSRAVREAQTAKAKTVAKKSSSSDAIKNYAKLASIGGYTDTTTGFVYDKFGDLVVDDAGNPIIDKRVKVHQPNVGLPKGAVKAAAQELAPPAQGAGQPASEPQAGEPVAPQLEYDPGALDAYIADLEKRQAALDERYAALQVPRGGNILDRTREAYQTQIGEGGFGISPRRLRELPRFDEGAAVAALQPMVDVKSRLNELEMLFPEDYKNLPEWSNLSNKLDKMQQVVSEARPVSSRQFLRKEQAPLPPTSFEPKYEFGNFIPSEMTNKQDYIQRLSDKELLRSEAAPNISAEEELIQLGAEEAARRAQPPGISNASRATMQRALELEALGVPALDAATKAVAENAPYSPSRPFEKMSGLETEMSGLGKPGGILDTARYLRQKRMEANAPVAPAPTPAPAQSGGSVGMLDESGNPIDLFAGLKEELQQRKQAEESMKALQGAVPETAPVITPKTGIQKLQEDAKKRKEAEESMKALQEAMPLPTKPQAQATPQSRSDLYAMRVTKSGLELAQKPAKLARLAKSDLPAKEREKVAPEWILTVDKLYNVNKGKPNAFKLTYDEIAKTYRNDPKLREQAQSYLIAKDTLESQVSAPLA